MCSSDLAAVLQSAFMAMTKDAAFLADAKKSQLDITPISGAAVRDIIAKMAATPKAVVERYTRIVNAF